MTWENPLSYLLGLGLWFGFSILLLVAYIALVSACNWLGRKWRNWRYGI
jgi:hypothetical protein